MHTSGIMGVGSGILLSILSNKRRQKEKEKERSFLKNGSLLLEKLIASCNGRGQITLRNFSTKELLDDINDINDFAKLFNWGSYCKIVRGSFEERSILIKKYDNRSSDHPCFSLPINDIAITAQMSKHKNVQKLLGCCLEFEFPALVYEYTGGEPLSRLLFKEYNHDDKSSILTWKSRLKIAKDIANAVVYLHSAFSTPIIHRNLNPSDIIVDQSGVAKLFDFCLAISLPPGELQVEDSVVGTCGYIAPEYCMTGIVTQKVDVYSFGMLLLMTFTGQRVCSVYKENVVRLDEWVKEHVEKGQFNEIVDRSILEEEGREGKEQEFQAFLALALRCIENKGADRPKMIDVTKELRRIEKSLCS